MLTLMKLHSGLAVGWVIKLKMLCEGKDNLLVNWQHNPRILKVTMALLISGKEYSQQLKVVVICTRDGLGRFHLHLLGLTKTW